MSNRTLEYRSLPKAGVSLIKAFAWPRKGYRHTDGMPAINAIWRSGKINAAAISQYIDLFELRSGPHLPVLYPHVLAGGMHINMLTDSLFPVRLLGAVHVSNRIIQHAPLSVDDSFELQAKLGDSRLKEKGLEFDILTQVIREGECVWEEVSSYFKAGRFAQASEAISKDDWNLVSLNEPAAVVQWDIPESRGKTYAKISGDYNPIHISKWGAKLFGFKRDIAHGFGVLAQALDQLARVDHIPESEYPRTVDVVFKGPVYLGSHVSLKQNKAQDPDRFDVFCGDNPRPSFCVAVTYKSK